MVIVGFSWFYSPGDMFFGWEKMISWWFHGVHNLYSTWRFCRIWSESKVALIKAYVEVTNLGPAKSLCQVLKSRRIAPATNLLECARRADGGAAIIVASSSFMDDYIGHDSLSSQVQHVLVVQKCGTWRDERIVDIPQRILERSFDFRIFSVWMVDSK